MQSLTEKSHAFHMQIMRGTHMTYMCVKNCTLFPHV